jgi:hypothetical protein
MHRRSSITSSTDSARRGLATLEFAMALPVLLLLVVGITWLGFSVIGQTEVLVESRNNAWEKRFEDASKRPLIFPLNIPTDFAGETDYTYSEDDDFVTEKATKEIKVSPVFDWLSDPESSHTILAGSWDHEAMKLDEPPDLKLITIAAITGTLGGILDLQARADDPLGLVNAFGNAKNGGTTIHNDIEGGKSNVGKDNSGVDSGYTPGNGANPDDGGPPKTAEQAKQETEADLERRKQEKRARYQALGGRIRPGDIANTRIEVYGGELEQIQDELIQLQMERQQASQAAINEQDEEKKRQLQEEAARAHRKVELADIKRRRLEAELRDTIRELDALGVDQWELYFGSGGGL